MQMEVAGAGNGEKVKSLAINSDFQPTIFSHIFLPLTLHTPSINVSQAAVSVNGSQCFVLRNCPLVYLKVYIGDLPCFPTLFHDL